MYLVELYLALQAKARNAREQLQIIHYYVHAKSFKYTLIFKYVYLGSVLYISTKKDE